MVLTFPSELTHERRRELFNHMKSTVVKIYVEESRSTGTGFFIDDNYILTANHNLTDVDEEGCEVPLLLASVYPWTDGIEDLRRHVQPLSAWVVRRDAGKDVALLQLDAPADHGCVTLETGPLGMWEEVHCICMPSSLEFSFFKANVNQQLCKPSEGHDKNYDPNVSLFEMKGIAFGGLTGASGAAIFNERGKVVGMLLGSNECVTWALQSEEISDFLNEFDY